MDDTEYDAATLNFNLVMGAAMRLAEDFEDPCECLPPCQREDWECACVRRAKLVLNIVGDITKTWDERHGS